MQFEAGMPEWELLIEAPSLVAGDGTGGGVTGGGEESTREGPAGGGEEGTGGGTAGGGEEGASEGPMGRGATGGETTAAVVQQCSVSQPSVPSPHSADEFDKPRRQHAPTAPQ